MARNGQVMNPVVLTGWDGCLLVRPGNAHPRVLDDPAIRCHKGLRRIVFKATVTLLHIRKVRIIRQETTSLAIPGPDQVSGVKNIMIAIPNWVDALR